MIIVMPGVGVFYDRALRLRCDHFLSVTICKNDQSCLTLGQSEPVVHIVDVPEASVKNFSKVEKRVGILERSWFTVGDDCQFC